MYTPLDMSIYTTNDSFYSVPEFKCLDKKEILKIADVLQEVRKLYVTIFTCGYIAFCNIQHVYIYMYVTFTFTNIIRLFRTTIQKGSTY